MAIVIAVTGPLTTPTPLGWVIAHWTPVFIIAWVLFLLVLLLRRS